jgi:hypothetical protein
MGQVPRGKDNQPRTDAALFGYIAYKLEGRREKELGIDVGSEGLRKAPLHSPRLRRDLGHSPALRKWLAVNWHELNFFMAAIRLRVDGGAEAIAQLEGVPGVVDLYSLEEAAIAQLIVVYERLHDREALEGRLGEFGRIEAWESVDFHFPDAAISTSRSFARDAARQEGLLRPAR